MNGATALIYARSRHGNNGQGSDFARSRRQQQIIVALKDQIESIGGFGKLPDVLNALGDNVLTNLTIGDAESLYGLVNDVNPATIEHISIDDTNFLYDCGYPTHCGSYYLYANDQELQVPLPLRRERLPVCRRACDAAHVTFVNGSGRNNDASTRWASLMNMVGFSTSVGLKAPTTGSHRSDRQQRRDRYCRRAVAGDLLRCQRHDRAAANRSSYNAARHSSGRPAGRCHRHTRQRRRASVPW